MDLSPRLQTLIIAIFIMTALTIWGYFLWGIRYTDEPVMLAIQTGDALALDVGLSQTGSLASGSDSIVSGLVITGVTQIPLTLYMPESRYTPAWSRVIQTLSTHNIALSIVTYRGAFFQDKIIDQDIVTDAIDVILVDTDHVARLSGWAQTRIGPEDMHSFVHPVLSQNLKLYPYRFPRGLDRAVTWTNTPVNLSMTMDYLRNLQSVSPSKTSLYIPILFGETSGDLQMLQDKTHPILDPILLSRLHYHNDTTPAYAAITQSVLQHNNKYRSPTYLTKIAELLIKKDPDCADLIGRCMLSKKMTSVLLGWMSDRRIVESLNSDVLRPQIFPHRTQTYPCKGRGFVINKQSAHKPEAIILLQTLIGSLNRLDFDLYDGNLSAYQQMLDIQLQGPALKSWLQQIRMCHIPL